MSDDGRSWKADTKVGSLELCVTLESRRETQPFALQYVTEAANTDDIDDVGHCSSLQLLWLPAGSL